MATISTPGQITSGPDDSPTLTYLKEKKPIPYNPWWIVTSILVATVISIFLYVVPTWQFLEVWTRDVVLVILHTIGVNAHATGCADGFCTFPWTPSWSTFGEAFPNTPGVSIPNTEYPAYWIVKACTGFQAGAILIALIIVTPLKNKSLPPEIDPITLSRRDLFRANHQKIYNFLHKLAVIGLFWAVLFVANSIRIAFHLWLVSLGYTFEFAHDDLSKPIGFFGTLLFAWIIEKSGVPIIDTFADWLDAIYLGLKAVISKVI
ncbi:MAG: heimdallarchaeosortase [Candidatus Thorarchaeota archaeon]